MQLRPSILVRHFDWISAITVLILLSVSLIMLYSIALGSGDALDMSNFKKQAVFSAVGIAVYLIIAFYIDYRILLPNAILIYGLGVAVLAALLIFGQNIRGTTGWFDFGYFSVQPVEFVKIAMVIFLARFLVIKAKHLYLFKNIVASAVGVGIMIAMVLAQPDFGSAMVLLVLWFGLLVMAGIKWRHIMVMISSFAAFGALLWFFIFKDYQRDRILVFLDPTRDPLGVGYNITQAIIAIGSGQWFGRGLTFGSQSKLKFLPEAQTDFIFAVIAEQLGFFGVVVIIALYVVLFWRLFISAKESRDNFGIFLILGALILLFSQVMINIGMNLGLLPVTGLTLPLLSYGGSSLLATMILLGLTQSIIMRNRV